MNEEWYRFPSNTVRWTYSGDEIAARLFSSDGRKLLYDMLSVAKTGNLSQYRMVRYLYDVEGKDIGRITGYTHQGMHSVDIYIRKVSAEKLFYVVYLVLATFNLTHERIYFQVGRDTEDTKSHDFYIDLSGVFSDLGHSLFSYSTFCLSVVENNPSFGTLFYFTNGETDEEFRKTGWVIKFKVGDPVTPENIVTYDTKTYTQHSFSYEVDSYDLSDSTVGEVVITRNCEAAPLSLALDERLTPDLIYGTPWYPNNPTGFSEYLEYYVPYIITDTLGSYSWTQVIHWDFYDVPQISRRYLGDADVTYSYIQSWSLGPTEFYKVWTPPYPVPITRAIKPIGASCWIEGSESLSNLKWGIHFYCIGEFRVTKNWTITLDATPKIVEIDSPDDGNPIVHYTFNTGSSGVYRGSDEAKFRVPFILYRTESDLVMEDKFDLWSVRWNVDGYTTGYPWGATIGGNFTPDRYAYKRTHPIRNNNGTSPSYLYECVSRKQEGITVTDFFKLITPGVSVELGSFNSSTYTYWTKGPDAHAGGGDYSRTMTRIDTAGYLGSSDFDRSVYVIANTLYDYDDPLPREYSLGRVSRELLQAYEYFNMPVPFVLDSDYINVSQLYVFTARDGIHTLTSTNSFTGGSHFSDAGVLDIQFFR